MISSILLAISSSLDNLVIGITYGIKNIHIKFSINIIIALIVTLGTFISMALGAFLCNFIPIYICNHIGAGLLIIVGIYMGISFFKEQKELKELKESKLYSLDNTTNMIESLNYDDILNCNKTADINHSGNIEFKEAISLALALSINNFSLGLGTSMSGINITLATFFTFIFSILTIIIGLKIGNSFLSKIFGKYSGLLSSIIIILMGIFQLL